MLEKIKYTEFYNCWGIIIFGSSVVILLGVSVGNITGYDYLMPVGMVPEGSTVAYMGDSNDVISRVELDVIFNKILVSGVN